MKLRLIVAILLAPLAPAFADSDSPSSALPHEENSIGMSMIQIPAGEYLRGERPKARIKHSIPRSIDPAWVLDREKPAHIVIIPNPLWVGATEVTVGQFREFVDATGYRTAAEQGEAEVLGFRPPKTDADEKSLHRKIFAPSPDFSWKNPGFEQTDRDPVVGITFQDAEAFCKWLSEKEDVTYRLPTEAEWEYFCRAGSDGHFSFGNKPFGVIQKHANIGDPALEKKYPGAVLPQWVIDAEKDPSDGHVFTAPVASFQPNAWGLYDTHGNVWEWCSDPYRDTAYRNLVDAADTEKDEKGRDKIVTLTNPVNKTPQLDEVDTRVIRGGSFYTGPVMARAEARAFWVANDAACYLGFRVVRDARIWPRLFLSRP